MQPVHTLTMRRPVGAPMLPAALREYRAVDLDARVAAASPHMLILMLFDRLAVHLNNARLAAEQRNTALRLQATEKALAIIDGLDMSLDEARGGGVARSLHASYALVRARVTEGSAPALADALIMTAALAEAWRSIAPAAARGAGPERG